MSATRPYVALPPPPRPSAKGNFTMVYHRHLDALLSAKLRGSAFKVGMVLYREFKGRARKPREVEMSASVLATTARLRKATVLKAVKVLAKQQFFVVRGGRCAAAKTSPEEMRFEIGPAWERSENRTASERDGEQEPHRQATGNVPGAVRESVRERSGERTASESDSDPKKEDKEKGKEGAAAALAVDGPPPAAPARPDPRREERLSLVAALIEKQLEEKAEAVLHAARARWPGFSRHAAETVLAGALLARDTQPRGGRADWLAAGVSDDKWKPPKERIEEAKKLYTGAALNPQPTGTPVTKSDSCGSESHE